MSDVFIIPFHVKPAANSIMPADFIGAYVSCYVQNADFEQAARSCLKALDADGLLVEEIMQPIHTMPLAHWSVHVSEKWSEQVTHMPDQATFEESMRAGRVVYGPFGAYDKPT